MSIVILILFALLGIIGLASFVCFILVVVQMFQHDQTALGVVTIVLTFCGLGPLLAFIYGWVKASEWRIKKLMTNWSLLVVANIVLGVVYVAVLAPQFKAQFQAIQEQQKQMIEQMQKEQQKQIEELQKKPQAPIEMPEPAPAPEK